MNQSFLGVVEARLCTTGMGE
ncbi:hypothetical protein E2C01_098003 [Portunus trituberculatus]|uniref:Uncharacterized protein n=1 Tax=Portunus trituberculatus TaxID=210409 RepID=A0A5B7K1U9_PORTR|nr:hypothetical protein [Portunus trituberculatus]